MAWWRSGLKVSPTAPTGSTPKRATVESNSFKVSSTPSNNALMLSSSLLAGVESARSKLSMVFKMSFENFSNANLCAFSTSCSLRRRILSISARVRSNKSCSFLEVSSTCAFNCSSSSCTRAIASSNGSSVEVVSC